MTALAVIFGSIFIGLIVDSGLRGITNEIRDKAAPKGASNGE